MKTQKTYYATNHKNKFICCHLFYEEGSDYSGGLDRGYYADFNLIEVSHESECIYTKTIPGRGMLISILKFTDRNSTEKETKANFYLAAQIETKLNIFARRNGIEVTSYKAVKIN